jgi:cation transport ATPase
VVTVLPVDWMGESDLLRAATAVACGAGHPVAGALLREADARIVSVVEARNCERSPCGGAAGVVSGSRILLGGPEWLLSHGIDLTEAGAVPLRDGVLFVSTDGRFAGTIAVAA